MISDPMSLAGWLIPLGFVLLGGFLCFVGLRQAVRIRHRKRHWLRYRGEVYDLIWRNRGRVSEFARRIRDDPVICYWMLRWIDDRNVERTARNPYGIAGRRFEEPPFAVEILVDPADPRSAQVADGAHAGGSLSVTAAVVGFLLALIGLVSLTGSRLL